MHFWGKEEKVLNRKKRVGIYVLLSGDSVTYYRHDAMDLSKLSQVDSQVANLDSVRLV